MCQFTRVIRTIVVVAAMTAGCEKKPSEEVRPTVPSLGNAIGATVEAKLAKADAVDGKVDKVLTKCPGCGLKMDGKKEHAATIAGFTVHFCSASCKADFEKDPSKAVMALIIPGE